MLSVCLFFTIVPLHQEQPKGKHKVCMHAKQITSILYSSSYLHDSCCSPRRNDTPNRQQKENGFIKKCKYVYPTHLSRTAISRKWNGMKGFHRTFWNGSPAGRFAYPGGRFARPNRHSQQDNIYAHSGKLTMGRRRGTVGVLTWKLSPPSKNGERQTKQNEGDEGRSLGPFVMYI